MAKDNKLLGEGNRDTIELYLRSEPGTVELTDKQKELLQRWVWVDEQIRKNEMRRETIAQLAMNKFGVSRHTAYQDIVNTEAVFSSSTPLNKKYRIQLRIEFLEMKINELYNNLEKDSDADPDEDFMAKIYRIKQNKEYILEATQLEKVLAKYYEMYPDVMPPRSPKKIIFNVQQNILPATAMPADEALQKGLRMINIKPQDPHGGTT